MKYLIVGAGFSGAVIAEQLSQNKNNRILLVDQREHIGGNCYTTRHAETEVMIHKYGPHIFHTKSKDIWNYVCQFCEMMPFTNRVKSISNGKVYSLPINLHTINQFFGKVFSPAQAKSFLQELGNTSIVEPKNFEEQALKFIGRELYEAFFYGYTKKQWGCEPALLPASVLKRLPVRFDYNDNYYTDPYQGIPKNGYTEIFNRMLKADNIEVRLNCKFDNSWNLDEFDHLFYTGTIDAFFSYKYGELSYRTVYFEQGISQGDYQGNAVINYADEGTPYTRIHEHKHFAPWEMHDKTVYFKEYSKETTNADIPYYPKRLDDDLKRLEKYENEASKLKKVSFVGRLATYRYLDMEQVIREALEVVKKINIT